MVDFFNLRHLSEVSDSGSLDKARNRLVLQLRRLTAHALTAPLFQQRLAGINLKSLSTVEDFQRVVPPLPLDDLETARTEQRDPYAGRKSEKGIPCLIMQMEYDPPLYIALSRAELRTYAGALTRSWQLLGVRAGDRVGLYDYGTSPATYLASAGFAPYLSRGAAEALGCVPLCNDGLPEMASRAVHILRYVHPRTLFIRQDALRPFLEQLARENVQVRACETEAVVVTGNEEVPDHNTRLHLEEQLGVPLHTLVRADAALFLAPECPTGKRWHSWSDLYFLEVLDEDTLHPLPSGEVGLLTITPLFARTCPLLRYVSTLTAALEAEGCPCGKGEIGISLA